MKHVLEVDCKNGPHSSELVSSYKVMYSLFLYSVMEKTS